jgi:hypothetical protein
MTISKPLSSMTVMTTLLLTDSLIPRALRHATKARNPMAAGMVGMSTKVAS